MSQCIGVWPFFDASFPSKEALCTSTMVRSLLARVRCCWSVTHIKTLVWNTLSSWGCQHFQTQHVRKESTKATGNSSILAQRHCQCSMQGLSSSKVPKSFRLNTHISTRWNLGKDSVTCCSFGHHTPLGHPTVFYTWKLCPWRNKFRICCNFDFKRMCCARKASAAELQGPIFRNTAQIPAL